MRNNTRGASFRKMLISSAAIATAAGALTLTATAQGEEDEAAVQDTVVVTGSRIPGDPNLGSSVPVQSLAEDDIQLSGELNLADVVNDIPALVSSFTGDNTINDGIQDVNPGSNTLNLRGLGRERTLVLVNGRRHVAGFRGSQAVDIGSIPRALVQSVEVTTGGASAVYGADAVSGVVNFILKDDFEGVQLDVVGGLSGEGDAESFAVDATFGKNFDNDKGNIVLALSYEDEAELKIGDRSWSRNNGIPSEGSNPDLNGPSRALIYDPNYWLSSNEGSIAPSFGGRNTIYVDINNNGIADCQESTAGRSTYLAGCWFTNADGTVSVFQDGLVPAGGIVQQGGTGARFNFDTDSLVPENQRFVANLNAKYDVSPNATVYFEGKYVNSNTEVYAEYDTYYDTLAILPDNPFIPTQLQPVVNATGYLLLTQDPSGWNDDYQKFERETYRFVSGVEWEIGDGHIFDFSVNHGKFKLREEETEFFIDRIFAGIDSTTDTNGNIVCRSDLDPTAAYEIDYFVGGNGFANGGFSTDRYYSFTPGDGSCQPLNPFGVNAISQAAKDWIVADIWTELEVEQTVLSATMVGEFDTLQNIFAAPIGYAVGAEYRDESSQNTLDPIQRGILPAGTSLTPGVYVGDIDPWVESFASIDNVQLLNSGGGYDVYDVFAEVKLPLIRDAQFAKDLSIDAAVRVADYSTLGETTTWKLGGTWAPSDDIKFRATWSEAVRAPNIGELFDPRLPIFINEDNDPCDAANVADGSANREANCIAELQAAGVPLATIVDGSGTYIWDNPLTARFTGVSGGNPDLDVETSESFTIGAVFQPTFLEGFTATLDYWDITIEDAISSVAAGDILDGCLDSSSYPNVDFCGFYQRRGDGGLTTLESGEINFASLEASGIDFSANYTFDVGENTFTAGVGGSYQEKLDRFFNPLNPADVDVALEEIQIPELSGTISLGWERGPLTLGLQSQYMSRQAWAGVEIEEVLGLNGNPAIYGDGGLYDEIFILDANGSYEFSENLTLFGGINNLADEEPFEAEFAWPVGPEGRYFFFGFTYTQ